jgi:hypothetical protein
MRDRLQGYTQERVQVIPQERVKDNTVQVMPRLRLCGVCCVLPLFSIHSGVWCVVSCSAWWAAWTAVLHAACCPAGLASCPSYLCNMLVLQRLEEYAASLKQTCLFFEADMLPSLKQDAGWMLAFTHWMLLSISYP